MAAHDFLKRISKCPSGQECITVGGPPAFPISIMEDSCLACLNRAKRCPGEALRIINLPSNLTTNVTHQYGLNSFKLHGLPTPRAGNVLGILGCNGIGKSTALNTLCGRLKRLLLSSNRFGDLGVTHLAAALASASRPL